jgi:hypothetical protein
MAGKKAAGAKTLWCPTCRATYEGSSLTPLQCPGCWPTDYSDEASVNRALVQLGHAQVARLDSIRTATQWVAVIVAAFAALVILGVFVGFAGL